MKLVLVTILAVASLAAAVEDASEQQVKICGDDLLKALQEACEQNSIEYLLQHGQYTPDIQDKRHEYRVHHDGHGHDHDHGHDHSHNHRHDTNYDNHSHAHKKDDNSITEECCHKPCLVKEFTSFCG